MIPEEAIEAAEAAIDHADNAWRHGDMSEWAHDMARAALEAAAPHMLAPALVLAEEWDAVAEVFPRAAAGIFAKSHACRLREALGGGSRLLS